MNSLEAAASRTGLGLAERIAVCPECGSDPAEFDQYGVCRKCHHYLKLGARDRLQSIIDDVNNFVEYDTDLKTVNPLGFDEYEQKLAVAQRETEMSEAVVTGEATIGGERVVLGIMDSYFMSASMGSVVGERITRAFEHALEKRLPAILFCASGGARMQEGVLSLMQMAKTSAAVARLHQAGLLYVSVLTHPTSGGVSASFAFQGDIMIAEPGALICFTGPRVIEQTTREKLPEGFQTAEFMREHGMIDMIVERKDMRAMLHRLLRWHRRGEQRA